jgi:hypothetical protein
MVFLSPGSCQGSNYNLATIISFHILANSVFTVIKLFDSLWLWSEHKQRIIAVILKWWCSALSGPYAEKESGVSLGIVGIWKYPWNIY